MSAVRTEKPLVALTFDDGPDPALTPLVADALAARGHRGTFFVLAPAAEAAPEVLRHISAGGHQVGLHGDVHHRLTGEPVAAVWRATSVARRRVERMLGQEVRWFRPPQGAQRVRERTIARLAGLDVAVWSVGLRDWEDLGGPDANLALADGLLVRGAIVCLHDVRSDDVGVAAKLALIERLLDELDRLELRSVTLDELMASGDAVRGLWLHR